MLGSEKMVEPQSIPNQVGPLQERCAVLQYDRFGWKRVAGFMNMCSLPCEASYISAS